MIEPKIINKSVWDRLTKIYNQNKLSGAYLFVGPKGLGKLDLAFEFVFLDEKLKQRKELVEKGGHSDVVILKPQIEEKGDKIREKQISIEETQEALKKFSYCLAEAKRKFLVIQSAEKLTHQASNSLLKIVEELPKNYTVILITSSEDRVLKTIQSRCQKIYFNLKSDEEIKKFIEIKNTDLNTDLIFLARGRIKEAQRYLEDSDYREENLKKIELFKEALRGDLSQGFKIAEEETKDKEKFSENLDNWLYYLRNFLKDSVSQDQDLKIQRKVFEITRSLNQNRKVLNENQNANPRLLVENFFVQIK